MGATLLRTLTLFKPLSALLWQIQSQTTGWHPYLINSFYPAAEDTSTPAGPSLIISRRQRTLVLFCPSKHLWLSLPITTNREWQMKKQLNFGHVKAELDTHQRIKTSKPGHYQQSQAWTSFLVHISHGEGLSRDPSGTYKWMQLPPAGFSSYLGSWRHLSHSGSRGMADLI